MSMRGLVVFISDLRNARARELEEKRINTELAKIRSKFKETKLSGYEKKKYVCKLLYMYILGWDVDFGHLETVNLISSNKFSEKQIGYLGVTLFLNENHTLIHLVVNSIKKDLLDNNELFNCLALHCIANVGGREMGQALSQDVHQLLVSPASKPFVVKKAALTLLRLYRKEPGVLRREWTERIIALMDHEDLGVALSVASLVSAIVQDQPDMYSGVYTKAVHRLRKIVINRSYSADYLYYRVPIPWLQVKLLRLLQYFPSTPDQVLREMLIDVLAQIIESSEETPKNVQQNNAQNAVLFEAISLTIHLDLDKALVSETVKRLGKFISSKETNIRYLGLEAMAHLAARVDLLEPLKRHQQTIMQSLKDRDISVRRRGLDLLYSMCDQTNAKSIVNELMRYLPTAEYALREEMVLKIAILVEKYTTEYDWYITVTLQLLAVAGDNVSDEVWQRIIQIVSNNDELQEHASREVLQYLKATACHENLVKVGGYVLGEFGHLIANSPGCSPIEQFSAIHLKFNLSTNSARAMLLSTYIKFANLFPEIKDEIVKVFEHCTQILDAELQQRACEYLALCNMSNDDLLQTVCEEMPPFPEKPSALISRLHLKNNDSADGRTWALGGKDGLQDRAALRLDTQTTGAQRLSSTKPPLERRMSKLALETNTPTTPNGIIAKQLPNLASAAHLSPNWAPGYYRLIYRNEGLLYEDAQIQIGLRSEYQAQFGRLVLYFQNKSNTAYTSFTVFVNNSDHASLIINAEDLPETLLQPKQQIQQLYNLECLNVFSEAPTIRISYLAGALQSLTLKLPVALTKFMEPVELDASQFFDRWAKIGGSPREYQKIHGLTVPNNVISVARLKVIVKGFRWGLLDNVDPNPSNLVGAGVLHSSNVGKVGVLLRLEPNLQSNMFRLTLRATNDRVPAVLDHVLQDGHLREGVMP